MKFFRSIGIAGLGLLGGSIALAAREKGIAGKVYGYTRSENTFQKAKSLGLIDKSFQDFSQMVEDSEFIILCAPISVNVDLAKIIARVKPGALFTDVGSTKETIVRAVEDTFSAGHGFCGSHPMAGSEKRGIENASGQLFDGKTVIITPAKNSENSVVETVENFWASIGANVIRMESDRHDRICALTSHFPHLAAFLLVEMLSQDINCQYVRACIGSGFRDTTRIAASDQEIWSEIFLHNSANVLRAIEEFRKNLQAVESMIEKKDINSLRNWIEGIKKMRNQI
ncbi:MAG: prephenate dehydrogenase/arogenate dehydrogenase family protein [Candidatus Omnitrophica bacterium]|nr:prephenate dehydrogenase/arogenate dehydrogenase family protein [Candidatus Omnitrophota bacterium]MCM8828068.1 prephenate dehydrogenase/arogenate dehydrogenase family protein [Candidatus Omnitrophota bacterium]